MTKMHLLLKRNNKNGLKNIKKKHLPLGAFSMGPPGLEPGTYGL